MSKRTPFGDSSQWLTSVCQIWAIEALRHGSQAIVYSREIGIGSIHQSV